MPIGWKINETIASDVSIKTVDSYKCWIKMSILVFVFIYLVNKNCSIIMSLLFMLCAPFSHFSKLSSKRIIQTYHKAFPKKIKRKTPKKERNRRLREKKRKNTPNKGQKHGLQCIWMEAQVLRPKIAMESYFNAWNNVNCMWPLHLFFDTKFGLLARKFCTCTYNVTQL